MNPIIIIGAGLAGYTAAREFRKLDKSTPLLVITADDGGFYSKPMLSNAFAQGKHARQLISHTAEKMADQLGATIVTATRVATIDTASKAISTTGATYHYEKLVIAVGAQPIRLAIEGDADEVLSVNHLDEYAVFREHIERIAALQERSPARVTILGAGLIGCEFADDLAGAGHTVTLVDPNPLPLAALAAPALSQGLHSALVARGVDLQLGTTAARIDRDGNDLRVSLANGKSFATDIVLSAVGLRPDLRVAQAAKLSTARGIVIDEFGRTSAPDVFAIGDCAEYTSGTDGTTRTLPYIAPLMTAARAIARTLAGQATPIDLKPAPVIVKTPCYPLALMPPPLNALQHGSWETEHSDNGRTICRFYDEQGVMCGFGVAPQDANIRAELLTGLGNGGAMNIAA